MMHRHYHLPTLLDAGAPADWEVRVRELCADDRLLDALPLLLDGTRSTETIYGELLLAGFELDAIVGVLDWLHEQGLIGESPASAVGALSAAERAQYADQIKALAAFGEPQSNHFSPSTTAGLLAQAALKQSVVAIVGIGVVGAQLARALADVGVGRVAGIATGSEELSTALDDTPPNLLIYAPDCFDDGVCGSLNDLALSHAMPLLIYRRRVFDIELGPLVIPRQTACYRCHDLRRKAVLSESEALAEGRDPGAGGLNFPMGAEWLALEVVKFLTGTVEPVSRGRLSRFSLLTGLMTVHPLLKLPRCPACGVHRSRPSRKLWEE